jgi:hypothetical protein
MTGFPEVHTLVIASAILHQNYNNLSNEKLQLGE